MKSQIPTVDSRIYRQPGQRSNEIRVRFKTTSDQGLILFQSSGAHVRDDYLALAIARGHVQFSYNLGEQDETNLHILTSKVEVDDQLWHTVVATR